jgi:hypothetical protein
MQSGGGGAGVEMHVVLDDRPINLLVLVEIDFGHLSVFVFHISAFREASVVAWRLLFREKFHPSGIHLNAVAAQRQYVNRLTVVSYAGSTNPQWAGEAEAFIAWRDAALIHMFQQLAAVEADEIAPPSIEEFIGGITPIIWPA